MLIHALRQAKHIAPDGVSVNKRKREIFVYLKLKIYYTFYWGGEFSFSVYFLCDSANAERGIIQRYVRTGGTKGIFIITIPIEYIFLFFSTPLNYKVHRLNTEYL